MLDQDKAGNVVGGLEKRIAQSGTDLDPYDEPAPAQSRRGAGFRWKNGTDHHMPLLFGAGGPQDGISAMVQTFANRQIEDSVALHGNGDDAIDQNRYQRNQSNANTEFGFSQYKSGAMHSQRGKAQPGEGLFTVGSTDGLYSGDMTLRVDPYADIVDLTTQAIGASFSGVYESNKSGVSSMTDGQMGVNPFRAIKKGGKEDKPDVDMKGPISQVEEEEDGYDLDYYFDEPYYQAKEAEKEVERDFDSGLRRVNMKTSQGRQLERVATKEQILSAYQEANNSYAQVLKDHMGKAYITTEDKTETLEKLRQPNAKYQANQMGVGDISRDTANAYKSKTGKGTHKLNTLLVGV